MAPFDSSFPLTKEPALSTDLPATNLLLLSIHPRGDLQIEQEHSASTRRAVAPPEPPSRTAEDLPDPVVPS